MIEQWKYYNHALIPNTPPHESLKCESLKRSRLWRNPKVLFARWTSDYDCGFETNWWYCIKDEPFDIESLNAKKRYEIKKGRKFFEIYVLKSDEFVEDMYNIFIEAEKTYSINLNICKDDFVNEMSNTNDRCIFGAFSRESGNLEAYASIRINGDCINYAIHKALPSSESKAINAALVDGILEYYRDDLENGKYICDGERNIYHETRFQSYLEKYFGFKKVYCKLNLRYKIYVKLAVMILYPFRSIIDKISALSKISAVLKLHEIYIDKKREE